jgi:HNH endonuclease
MKHILERIESKTHRVKLAHMDTECWECNVSQTQAGYRLISYQGRTYTVHRISAHLFKGFDLASSLEVCHTCDNRGCWNPEHLFIGTRKDNFDDMKSKNAARQRAIDIILGELK